MENEQEFTKSQETAEKTDYKVRKEVQVEFLEGEMEEISRIEYYRMRGDGLL